MISTDTLTADQGAAGSTPWPVSATSLPLPTGAATQATVATRLSETDFDAKTGTVTEAAPASDTASSGLNGRLQRVAQRLTSLIGLFSSQLLTGSLSNITSVFVGAGNYLWNGTIWQPQQGIYAGTALTSAARTAAVNSAIVSNVNGKGTYVALMVTAAPAAPGTGGLTVDIADGTLGLLWRTTTKVTAVGTYIYLSYPGAVKPAGVTGAAQVEQLPVGNSLYFTVNHADAQAYTYSLSYVVLP